MRGRSEFGRRAGRRGTPTGERGAAKPRGRGLGRATQIFKRICVINFKNLKICRSPAKAPSHEKHFAPLDVRGLWHARPLPSILPFTTHGLRPRKKPLTFTYFTLLKHAIDLCCAARGHALAVWLRLAPSALAHARAPLGGQTRSAPRNNNYKYIAFYFSHFSHHL